MTRTRWVNLDIGLSQQDLSWKAHALPIGLKGSWFLPNEFAPAHALNLPPHNPSKTCGHETFPTCMTSSRSMSCLSIPWPRRNLWYIVHPEPPKSKGRKDLQFSAVLHWLVLTRHPFFVKERNRRRKVIDELSMASGWSFVLLSDDELTEFLSQCGVASFQRLISCNRWTLGEIEFNASGRKGKILSSRQSTRVFCYTKHFDHRSNAWKHPCPYLEGGRSAREAPTVLQ